MKTLIIIALWLTSSFGAIADDLATRHPIAESLDGKLDFKVSGGVKVEFKQKGDRTTILLNGEMIKVLKAPEFVSDLVQSDDGHTMALLINADASGANFVASNYHSVLRLRFGKNGELLDSKRFLEKTGELMKSHYRFVTSLKGILNDGRTIRLGFADPIDPDAELIECRHSIQIRNLETGELLIDEGTEDEKEKRGTKPIES
jgi:hypothetical protein